jgi:hypothetical protein
VTSLDTNLKKGHRSEVQMSVTYKSDIDLRIRRRLETRRRSESYIYTLLQGIYDINNCSL